MGFMFLALSQGSYDSLLALILYLIIYCFITLNFFVILITLRYYNTNRRIDKISEFSAIFESYPVFSFVILVNLFSIAGIPPLAGFWAKYYIFQCFIFSGSYFSAVFLLILSAIGAFYYLRIVKNLFFTTTNNWRLFKPIPLLARILVYFITGFNIFIFFIYFIIIGIFF